MLVNSRKRKRPLLLTRLMCCLSSLYMANVMADEFDTLQFSAAYNRIWDNNLFRLSNNEISDQVSSYTAGVRLDKHYSQQRLLINLNYIDTKYQTNDFLDFGAVNYDAALQWTLTPSLTGVISSDRTKTLAGFADYRSQVQNIRTTENNQFRAEYSPHKVWALIAGVSQSKSTNSQTFNAVAGYDYKAFDYGARYNFPSGTNISFLGHKRSSDIQRDLIPLSFLDNGYSEDEFELDVIFKNLGKSNLSSKIAYLSREYNHFSVRDYGAWLGYIRYDILLTGKLKASTEASRVLGAFETNYSTYSATDALTLNLSYFVSEKLILGVNGRYAERDFKQPVISGLPLRRDEERSIGASVTWQPIKNVSLIFNSTKSSRDASSGYNSFDYNDVTSSVTLDLKI